MRRAVAAAFPGSRLVWLGALAIAAVFAVILGVEWFARPAPIIGTNSVDVAAVVANARPREQTCIKDLIVPAHTRSVGVFLGLAQPLDETSTVTGVLSGRGGRWPVSVKLTGNSGGFKSFALDRVPARDVPDASLCLRAPRVMGFGGADVTRLPGTAITTLGGKPLLTADISVRYLGGARSLTIARLPAALRRATLFTDYWGGSALLWLVLVALLGVVYVVVRTAATAEGRSAGALARRAYLLALVGAAAWALMMPAFYGADESEHFAYVQHLATTGHRADPSPGPRPAYSTSEVFLLGGLHHNSSILNRTARPRWMKAYDRAYRQAIARYQPSAANGGGFTDSASGHAPLYYGLMAAPYKVLSGLSQPRLVVGLRLFNAALAALVAAFAVLAAAAVFPGRPGVWWTAGCLAGLQPVFDSVAATINNDTLVNVLAALSLYLLVDAWRSGPRRWRMATLGLATALLPIAKVTGFEMWPVIGIGALLVIWRHHSRPAITSLLWGPGTLLGALIVWLAAGGKLFNSHPGANAAGPPAPGVVAAAGPTLLDKVSYLVQEFVPFIHLTGDYWVQSWPFYSLYIERGFGRVGWLNGGLDKGVIHLVLGALIVGWALVAVAAWRGRAHWREWAGPVFILGLAVAAVVTFVAFAYATLGARPIVGEQGRYIFPALVALAVLLAAGAFALPRRWRELFYGVVPAAMALLALTEWLSALRQWFT